MSFSNCNHMHDLYNHLNKRNTSNTDLLDYNCGGYALNTYSWYYPYSLEECYTQGERIKALLEEHSTEEVASIFTEEFTDYLLNDFKNRLTLISNINEAAATDTVILFRVGIDPIWKDLDFHFRVRRNGIWTEKAGTSEIRDSCYDEKPWSWHGGKSAYDGPMKIFIFKEPSKLDGFIKFWHNIIKVM